MMNNKTNRNNDIDQATISRLRGKEGVPIFNQICRACLCPTNNKSSDQKLNTRINLLLNNIQEIRSLLEESTGVQIVDFEFLPNHICDDCFNTLIAWYKLRCQTQRSNEILKKYIKELETLLDDKPFSNAELSIHMRGAKLNIVPIPTQNVYQIQDFQVSVVKDKPEVVGFILHCDSCSMTFSNQMDLLKHQEEHIEPPNEKSFKCDRCEKSFKSLASLNVHKSYRCVPVDLIERCKTRQLDVHKEDLIAATEKIIKETEISCILCKKNFKSQEDFIAHCSEHNKDRKCHICHKDFACVKILERHVRRHLRAKVYDCPRCSRYFYTCRLFRAHMLEHGTIDWVYRCNVCQKEFFNVREFKNHIVKHYVEDETKTLENVKDTVEMENVDVIEIDSDDDSKNESTDKIETDISNSQKPFQQIESEKDAESQTLNQEETDSSFNIEVDYTPKIQFVESLAHSSSQLEEAITPDYESSIQVCETPIMINSSSSEDENLDQTDNDPKSTLSKSNDQIKKQCSTSIQNLLDKCNLNCHIAGCNTKCSTFLKIWEHFKRDHLKEYPFKCSTCFEQFDQEKAIKTHIRKYYSHKCPVCLKKKGNRYYLKRHVINRHSNDRPFKCLKCSKSFASASYLRCHEINHNSKKDFVCKICLKSFNSYSSLYRHSKYHKVGNECDSNTLPEVDPKNESINQKETEFASCQKPLEFIKIEEDAEGNAHYKPDKNESIQIDMDFSIDIMDSNQQLQLIETKNQSVDNNPYSNDTGVKALIDILMLEDHTSDISSGKEENVDEIDDIKSILSKPDDKVSKNQSANTQELLDKCKLNCYFAGCQTKGSSIAEIWKHIRIYHLCKKNPNKCSVCFEQFDHKLAFRNHIRKHYTFKCPVCSKIKTNASQLKTHVILSHSHDRPFQCSKCPKKFVAVSSLKAHEITHNSERNFVCKVCSKNFFCHSSLYKHKKKNHKKW